ncbi:helix-turn-helix domain-containing protein [Paenibacillus pinisoli]|nr:helix-turn-helix transcriptional regulator [Paenibacillus pinisoli]
MLREKHKLTQDQMAERIGVSRPTIAGYESEEKNRIPREDTLHKIADIFDVSIDYLLGRTDDPSPSAAKTSEGPIPGVYIAWLGGPPETMDEEEAEHLRQELEMFRAFKEKRRQEKKLKDN